MNKRVLIQWINALRSGRYYQTRCSLRNEGSFCALGVLCDLHSKEFGQLWKRNSYLGEHNTLPLEVRLWIGDIPEKQIILHNDFNDKDFFLIADYLEGILNE